MFNFAHSTSRKGFVRARFHAGQSDDQASRVAPSERAMETIRESVRKSEPKAVSKPLRPLSKREREVLRWVILGKSDRDIGQILSISPKTANAHVENIKRKYDVSSRVVLAHRVALQASSSDKA